MNKALLREIICPRGERVTLGCGWRLPLKGEADAWGGSHRLPLPGVWMAASRLVLEVCCHVMSLSRPCEHVCTGARGLQWLLGVGSTLAAARI